MKLLRASSLGGKLISGQPFDLYHGGQRKYLKSTQHGLRQGLTGKMFFVYQLYITMAASLLVNQTFAIPFNFFPALVLLMLTLIDCPESGNRGNFFKSSSIRALVRFSPKLFPYLWMLSDRDERPHCQPHRTLPGQQILIRNAPGSPVRVDIQLLRKKFDCRGKVNLVFKQVF